MPGVRRKKEPRDDRVLDPRVGDLVEAIRGGGVEQLRVESVAKKTVTVVLVRDDVETARHTVPIEHYRAECIRVQARLLRRAGE